MNRRRALQLLAIAFALAGSGRAAAMETWFLAGSHPDSYEIGAKAGAGENKGAAGYIKPLVANPPGFGTMMQTFAANDFRSKRVRFSAAVKSEGIAGWAALWMRVDGPNNEIQSFDNMSGRPIKGTTAWQRYDVVLDVPGNAYAISIGILLYGKGIAWIDAAKVEAVPKTVAITAQVPPVQLSKKPQNLDFAK